MAYTNKSYLEKFLVFIWMATSIHTVKAVGFQWGPCGGIGGKYSTWRYSTNKELKINHIAYQVGLFAKLDMGVIYLKTDPSFVFNRHSIYNKEYVGKNIVLPLTMGIPLFNIICPHIGVNFKFNASTDEGLKNIKLIDQYKAYILGIGVHVGNFIVDLDYERGWSAFEKGKLLPDVQEIRGEYTPQQFSLRVGYNLTSLFS